MIILNPESTARTFKTIGCIRSPRKNTSMLRNIATTISRFFPFFFPIDSRRRTLRFIYVLRKSLTSRKIWGYILSPMCVVLSRIRNRLYSCNSLPRYAAHGSTQRERSFSKKSLSPFTNLLAGSALFNKLARLIREGKVGRITLERHTCHIFFMSVQFGSLKSSASQHLLISFAF